jgi:branched-chain amino acid transport system substrate-binding protein
MRRHRRLGLLSVVCCAALIAASCGDDDDDSGGGTATTAADGGTATTAADGGTATTAADGGTATTAADGGTATTAADGGTATTAGGGGTETTAGGGGGATGELADDSRDGQGAAAFEAAVNSTADAPLTAEGDPFKVSMINLEGDAAGTFPDAREGAEAAVQFINEQLGGIGADYEAGTPGRPIELTVCSHTVTQEEAQRCANEIVGQDPDLIQIGVDFFTPLLYPVFQGVPTVQNLPIFVADFDQPGVFSAIGGCPGDFITAAQFMVETRGYDRVAIPWSNTPPGQQCWADTQERFYQYYKDQSNGAFDFKGFSNEAGDPSDNPAMVQNVADFLEGAENPGIYFGVQSSDCVEFIKGLRAAGVEADIVASSACDDETVRSLPESNGMTIGIQGYNVSDPESLTDFANWELGVRDEAIDAYGPEAAKSAFMNDSFSTMIWMWQLANDVVAAGGDPSDAETFQEALNNVASYHIVGRPPIDCAGVTSEYRSICKRTETYVVWDGETFTADPALGGEYIDATDLMNAVAEANPRQG